MKYDLRAISDRQVRWLEMRLTKLSKNNHKGSSNTICEFVPGGIEDVGVVSTDDTTSSIPYVEML